MDYTFATLVVPDASVEAARELIGPGFFSVGLSADGASPATHWMSSGAFGNAELNAIVGQAAVPYQVRFGPDWASALQGLGLVQIADTAEAPPEAA